jgi:hypothetical protein
VSAAARITLNMMPYLPAEKKQHLLALVSWAFPAGFRPADLLAYLL